MIPGRTGKGDLTESNDCVPANCDRERDVLAGAWKWSKAVPSLRANRWLR